MDMMQEMDLDGNGTVDLDEFIAATVNIQMINQTDALTTAFKTIDKDNSGYITPDEIESCLVNYGFSHEAKDIVTIIKECDTNSDGKISYDEFVHMMQGQIGEGKTRGGVTVPTSTRRASLKQPI